MLASDLNNTEFAGARNPNDLLHVEFYDHAALDDWKTRETGIKSYKAECPFIRIAIPGNPNLTVERPADGRDMQEYPRQWLVFQMQTGKIANAENVPGWQLETWDEVTPEQARQLKFLRFTPSSRSPEPMMRRFRASAWVAMACVKRPNAPWQNAMAQR